MTPIPFDLPARILPPTTAYAAGLVCELRPDLADGVRSAVLGDAAMTALDVMTLARVEAGDEQGANALAYLREIVHYGGNAPKDLHGLADVLGLIPAADKVAKIIDRGGEARVGVPTIGDVVLLHERTLLMYHASGVETYSTVGIRDHRTTKCYRACDDSDVLLCYLRDGFAAAWASVPRLPGTVDPLFAIVALHAHTVSLDPDTRAAWAKAHLDALTPPIRPQSPDRLT